MATCEETLNATKLNTDNILKDSDTLITSNDLILTSINNAILFNNDGIEITLTDFESIFRLITNNQVSIYSLLKSLTIDISNIKGTVSSIETKLDTLLSTTPASDTDVQDIKTFLGLPL